MDAAIIRFQRVSKGYGTQTVLEDFSVDIREREFLTIVGTSGGGKTTMLKMVNGLNLPDAGKVLIRDEDILEMDLVELRRKIGYAIQGTGLFPHMTVAKNIAYVPSLRGGGSKDASRRNIVRLMELVGLEPELAGRYPAELSGGQQQRVGIARALASSPEILLMDEPFGAVDELTRKMLQEEIQRIHRELRVTILFVTHDVHEALLLGTRVLVMDQGRIAQLGSPDELTSHPATPYVQALVSSKAPFG